MEVLDIRQLIGEATEYDKKVALEVKKPKSWCKSVSAFANGMGGRLIWGIADDDTLVGLADAKGMQRKLARLSRFTLIQYQSSTSRSQRQRTRSSLYSQ